jgi:hypothetical protein
MIAKEISPSSLPKLAECALFTGAPGTSAAAERGTLLDKAIRELLVDDPTTYDGLAAEDQAVARWGVDELRTLSGGYHVETREEHLGMEVPGLSKPGTADAVCVRAQWVADIKTGQVRNYREQLAAYALACMHEHFADSWTAHVVYVDQRLRRTYTFTREQAEATVSRIIAEASSRLAEPTPNEYCGWCAHQNGCRALVRQSSEALALVKSDLCLSDIRDQILANPVELSAFAANWKLAEKQIAEPVLDALKERLAAGEEIPGWKVTTGAGRQFVEADAIARASANVSKETLILALGGKMSADKFRQFCLEAGVEVDESAVRAGSPITTLRQIKSKK